MNVFETTDNEIRRVETRRFLVSNDGHTPRVLLVDDSPMNLLMLKSILAKMGKFDLLTATNGREALDCLNEHEREGAPVDAVFTDVWMPEMSGDELVDYLRGDERFAQLPIYAVTTDREIHTSYAQMGFDGCCLKPYAADDLRPFVFGAGVEESRTRVAM